VFVGSGTIEKRGTGILTLTGSSAFTGTLNIYEGSIYLDRNLGRFPTVGTINLGGYGVLQTDTSGNSQVSSDGIANMSIPRFNPDADINLDGGAILRFKGNVSLATGIINEQASTIKVNSGTPTLELGYASGADWQVNLEFSGIERQAGSALVVRAFNAIGGAEGVAGANRYTFEGGIETVGGTGAYNTTTAAIVPWMFGAPASSNNNANPGNNTSSGFMTYSEEFGLQHVTTYQDNINNAAADENVSIGNATLNSTKTINALRTTTTANATLNLGTDHVLTIASGAMLIAANNYSIIGSGLSAINFGNREGIIFVGSSAGSTTVTPHTATISARLTNSGTNGFTKAGPGTLILEGANDYGGDTWVAGGVLRAGAANVLPAATGLNMANGGAPAFNANSVNFPEAARFDLNGFSQTIGSLSGGGEFGGDVLLNGATLTTGGNGRSTTYAGVISGSTAGSNLVKTGTGSFRLTGTNTYIGSTTVSDGTLIVDGSIAASSGVSVGAGARLKGTGQVSSISGAGTVAPGNSPGILTATEVNGAAGLDFDFEFTLANTATLDWQGDIENSVLRLTGDTPFVVNLNSSNVINLYLSGDLYASLSESTYLIGGFYTETGAAFDASVTGATINAFRDIGGGNYVAITSGFFSVSTVANSGLDEDGFVTRFDFTAVPEPSSAALWLLGIAGLAARRRRKS
jgi:MYXO-CTERM domain-containing protein